MEITLIVIRTAELDKVIKFYALLGLEFEYHRHGNSPYHYSAKINKTVFEIYPLMKEQKIADNSIRLGFQLDNYEGTIIELQKEKTNFIMHSEKTEWGIMSIVTDPDGRKIELYK